MKRPIEVIRLGAGVRYDKALCLQTARRADVEAGHENEALFLLEHAPVITLGRRARPEHVLRGRDELASMGIEVRETDRGGDVTYHGPGQLVAYPILHLAERQLTIHQYLRALEEVLIRVAGRYGLRGERREGFTGVWVGDGKVAAIGVGIHGWVTYHGLALNVDPNIAHFGLIVPCGIADKPVTSLRALLGEPPSIETVMRDLEEEFLAQFGKP